MLGFVFAGPLVGIYGARGSRTDFGAVPSPAQRPNGSGDRRGIQPTEGRGEAEGAVTKAGVSDYYRRGRCRSIRTNLPPYRDPKPPESSTWSRGADRAGSLPAALARARARARVALARASLGDLSGRPFYQLSGRTE